MGPLVTMRLELMDKHHLRLKPDDLFGNENGQQHHLSGRRHNVKNSPYGAPLWDARAEVMDPNYAAKCVKCTEADREAKAENKGGKSMFAGSFKRMVVTEARIAQSLAFVGGKTAAVDAVAKKYLVNACTLWGWMQKYAPKSRQARNLPLGGVGE